MLQREDNNLKLSAINQALRSLNETERDIVLRVAQGYSYSLICSEWLISKGFISKTIQKFRLQVIENLKAVNDL